MDNIAKAIEEFVNGALGVDPTVMIIQIASTIVLFLVVKFFFWNYVTDFIEKRKETMNEEYDKAQQANENAREMKQQAELELHEIRQSAKGMYDDAKERGELARKEIIAKAREEADRMVKNAQAEIEQELVKTKNEMNNEIVSVATLMAEKIIQQEIDAKKHKKLIDDTLEEVAN